MTNVAAGGTGFDFNHVLSQGFKDSYLIGKDEGTHALYLQAIADTRARLQRFNVRNKDEGDEFLTSDGVSLRGYQRGTERPFHDVTKRTWTVGTGDDSWTSYIVTQAYAERGLRGEGLSRQNIRDWLNSIASLFTPKTPPENGDLVKEMTYFAVSSAAPTTNMPAGGTYVGLRVTYLCGVAGSDSFNYIDQMPWAPVDGKSQDLGVTAFFLCDSKGVPVAMRYEEDMSDLTLPGGDAPFMFFNVEGVEPDRVFKLYRASYEEMQTGGEFIVPSKFSYPDQNWETVAVLAGEFPAITKGFTFFKKLGAGLRRALGAVWKHREAISAVSSAVIAAL
jgi:hypothetical protein